MYTIERVFKCALFILAILFYFEMKTLKFFEKKEIKFLYECPKPGTPVLSFKKIGRLGNQISSYVNLLILEKLYNLKPYLPSVDVKENIETFFQDVTMPVWHSSMNTNCNIQWSDIPSFSDFVRKLKKCIVVNNNISQCFIQFKSDSEFLSPSTVPGLISSSGHTLPRFEIIGQHKTWLIKKHLQLNAEVKLLAKTLLEDYRKTTMIGVHVRRTDYKDLLGGKYPKYQAQYYRAAIRNMTERYENASVVIVSDDMNWCRSQFRMPSAHFIGTSYPQLDLAVLSLCDHNIIDYGTFGIWGAYLSGGQVMLPNYAATKYGKMAKFLNWTILSDY